MIFGKFTVAAILCGFLSSATAQQVNHGKVFADAEVQTKCMLKNVEEIRTKKPELVTPRTVEHGELKIVSSKDWTSGFFSGVLWFLYEYSGENEWKQYAESYTALLEKEKLNAGTHDMGFKMYCSFGTGLRLTGNAQYKEVLIESAKTLITRFRPITGTIRSWDHNRDKWGYPVIIDNMMNLELLFAATQLSGDSSFYHIAVTHANTTMKNHFRNDFSTYHVVDYDTLTGAVVKKQTHQGYAHESAWARGQAWGLYGYTMCYRFTKDIRYLEQAIKIAMFMLNHPNMPKDLVPYWDYNAPKIPNEERDASAAAVLASALYELSLYARNGKMYKKTADKIIASLTNHYRALAGEHKGFLLLHSTGSKPMKSEVDVPLNYADYYYLEALLRAKRLKEGKSLF